MAKVVMVWHELHFTANEVSYGSGTVKDRKTNLAPLVLSSKRWSYGTRCTWTRPSTNFGRMDSL